MKSDTRVVFPQLVEGLFKPHRALMSPALLAEIKLLGIDLGAPLKPGYSREVFRQAVFKTRASLYPKLSDDEAFGKMGAAMVDGFLETIMGRAIGAFIRLGGPERNIKAMQRNFSAGANFLQITLQQTGPAHFTLLTNDVVTHKALMGASIRRSQEVAGAKGCVVTALRQLGDTVTFDVKWTP